MKISIPKWKIDLQFDTDKRETLSRLLSGKIGNAHKYNDYYIFNEKFSDGSLDEVIHLVNVETGELFYAYMSTACPIYEEAKPCTETELRSALNKFV